MSTYEEERAFQQAVTEGLVPKLMNSRVCVSLAPAVDQLDAKFATELGAMIMLDKPIIVVVRPGLTISKKLELVADKVVHADIATDAGRELLTEAITDMNLDEP
jgi:hypothetical protein